MLNLVYGLYVKGRLRFNIILLLSNIYVTSIIPLYTDRSMNGNYI